MVRSSCSDVEGDDAEAPVALLRELQEGALVEDAVVVVEDVAALAAVDRLRDRVIEVELGGQHRLLVQMHLRVDVDGAALVPAGIDRLELHDPVGVRHLRAAEERLPLAGVEPGVHTLRVAVPDVHDRVGQRLAIGVPDADGQAQGHTLAILGDVGANRVDVEVVRPLGLLGRQGARRRVVEERGQVPRRLRLHRRRGPVGGAHLRRGAGLAVVSAASGQQGAEAHGPEPAEGLATAEGMTHVRHGCRETLGLPES